MAKPDSGLKSFNYSGMDRRNQKVAGVVKGKNATEVKALLRKQGITANQIKKVAQPINIPFLNTKRKITSLEISIFVRQLTTMMKAGVPLVQSFEIVADGLDNPSMKEVVLGIKQEVETGNNFAGALAKFPYLFDKLFVSLVASGEQSGALETMLERVAVYKEKSEALRSKIKKAMKYPITVVAVAIIVTVILLVKVVPVFQNLFKGFGAQLPAFTQMVINFSQWVQTDGWILIFVFAGIFVAFSEAKKRSPGFVNFLDRLVLKLPIFGNIVYMAVIARYSRTLATTFAAGVPLIDALTSCADASGNVIYQKAILNIRDEVASGQQLTFSMKNCGLFPSMAVQMVSIGEESGKLDAMLDKVASHYESEVDNAVDGLTSMMEPLIMSVLGVLVGGLIIAMYLPIFQMGNAV